MTMTTEEVISLLDETGSLLDYTAKGQLVNRETGVPLGQELTQDEARAMQTVIHCVMQLLNLDKSELKREFKPMDLVAYLISAHILWKKAIDEAESDEQPASDTEDADA